MHFGHVFEPRTVSLKRCVKSKDLQLHLRAADKVNLCCNSEKSNSADISMSYTQNILLTEKAHILSVDLVMMILHLQN